MKTDTCYYLQTQISNIDKFVYILVERRYKKKPLGIRIVEIIAVITTKVFDKIMIPEEKYSVIYTN